VRTRALLGLLGGLLLLASSLAHAGLGWPAMRAALEAAGAPPELRGGLAVGWLFGSVAMAAFGVIVVSIALAALRGSRASRLPAAVIGIAYASFGAWAFLARGGNPHFLGFVAIGALVAVLAFPGRPRAGEAGGASAAGREAA
jgi:hypothetical protein